MNEVDKVDEVSLKNNRLGEGVTELNLEDFPDLLKSVSKLAKVFHAKVRKQGKELGLVINTNVFFDINKGE